MLMTWDQVTISASMLLFPLLLRDILDRKLQAEFTGDVLARAVHPVILLSYLTNKPHGRDYKRIVEGGKVKVNIWELAILRGCL